MAERHIKAEYLGVADAEALTGVSRWTWRAMAADGRVESVKLGGRLLIPAKEIGRLVNENTRPRRGAHPITTLEQHPLSA